MATRTWTFQVKVPALEGPTGIRAGPPGRWRQRSPRVRDRAEQAAGAAVMGGVDAGQTPIVVIGAADADGSWSSSWPASRPGRAPDGHRR
ncbi:MAG: hypothetical protein R3F43_28470 [bacterium]